MMFFGCLVSMLLMTLAMEGPVRNKKVKELTFEDMFLSMNQRCLHKGDMKGALQTAHTHEAASVSYPGALKIKEAVSKHLEDEKMTPESYRLPTFDTLKEAKAAFKDTLEAERRKKDTQDQLRKKAEQLKSQMQEIKGLIEQATAKEPTPNNTDILKRLEDLFATSKADLSSAQEQLIEALEDSIKREKFIDEHPKLFLNKKFYAQDQFGLKRAKDRMIRLGDGQVVLVDDNFSKKMPESLELKCVNASRFTNVPETNPEWHGVTVASVIVDSKIGVAPNAKFRAGNFVTEQFPWVLGPYPHPPPDVVSFEMDGDSLGEFEIKVLDICLRDGKEKFACRIGDEYYLIDTSSVKPFSELIINMSSNFADNINHDRSRKTSQVLAWLLAFATSVRAWIKQGKIIVWAAGNEGTTLGASSAYSVLRIFSKVYPKAFVVALALDSDHMSLCDFTNQPGDHPVGTNSLCAPGRKVDVLNPDGTYRKVSGTSYAAPFIAGAAALLASNYPMATGREIISALLDSATPIIMRKSPNRRYDSPYALRNVRSKELAAGKYIYMNSDGAGKSITVTKEMIEKSREKYGVGIINVSGALRALENIYGPIRP